MIPPDILADIARISDDQLSGATALLRRGVDLLKKAAGERARLLDVAESLCRAQPSMAGFRTAAAVVTASADPERSLDELSERVRRAPAAIARFAVPLIRLRAPEAGRLTIVTCSRSEAVERTLEALANREPVRVCCAESRPGCEGTALAEALASKGLEVDLYSDAAIGRALSAADALVVGADAVSETAFINKVGTAGLCSLAHLLGVTVHVLAGSEKILPHNIFQLLTLRAGPVAEVPGRPYSIQNPLFERTPSGWVSQFVTDRGALLPEDVQRGSMW
jgi:translation initiation factor 2B subunit (eIF-2B alpha/beta/delta family)